MKYTISKVGLFLTLLVILGLAFSLSPNGAEAYTPVPEGYEFDESLSVGDKGEDVKYLQRILEHQGFFPTNLDTGYFGSITNKAVVEFQEEYSEEVLDPWGLHQGTGYVGGTSRDKLNSFIGAGDENDPTISWWKEVPTAVPPSDYDDYMNTIPPGETFSTVETYNSSGSGTNRVLILINSTLQPLIQSSLSQFISDLETDGYVVTMTNVTGGTPSDIRGYLQGKYSSGLKGCILIGDLPVPWFEMSDDFYGWNTSFPMDLYYLDLDGQWIDADNDGKFEEHLDGTGDSGPEIWIGRLTAHTAESGKEVSLLKNYFVKNHKFRTGGYSMNIRSLSFVDDDWTNFKKNYTQFMYGDNAEFVNDIYETTAANYEQKLKESYEFMQPVVHSNPALHHFYISGASGGYTYNTEITQINPRALFYNLLACSNARYTTMDYMAGRYVFAGSYGLIVTGSTKTGAMISPNEYYTSLGKGMTFGESYKYWWEKNAPYTLADRRWYYGMTMLGDPTLKITLQSNIKVPTVVTDGADTIQEDEATLRGTLKLFGGDVPPLLSWFEWGETPAMSKKTWIYTFLDTGSIPYGIKITGLSPKTTYYYRLVVENSAGKGYGLQKSFTTKSWGDVCKPNYDICATDLDCCSKKCRTEPENDFGLKKCVQADKDCVRCDPASSRCYSYSAGFCLDVDSDPATEVCMTDGSWPDHCQSGLKDCDEEGTDCGGADCEDCGITCNPWGQDCSANSDCCSGKCRVDPEYGRRRCAPLATECIYCPNYNLCTYYNAGKCLDSDGDELNEICKIGGAWVDPCTDKIKNCDETGIDCGGDCPNCDTITVTFPNGGEKWEIGNTYQIKWTSSGVTGNVKIDLKGYDDTTSIASSTANTGSYDWTVPSSVIPSEGYLIRVESSDIVYDMSDNYFSISQSGCSSDGQICSLNSDCCSGNCKFDPGTSQERCLPANKECIYCSSSDSCNYYDTGSCTNVDSDAAKEICEADGTWVDHCTTGVQDCDETGIDCGGVDCASCDTSCHTTPLWSWDYCSTDCKCDAGEGDCDNDTHCNTGYCAKDVGTDYGQVSTMDVCEEKETKSITVLNPNGGEKWMVGNTYDIKWDYSGFDRVVIRIMDYTYSSEIFTYVVEEMNASSKNYSWTIPSNFFSINSNWNSGDDFKILVAESKGVDGLGVQDLSSNYFSIVEETTCTSNGATCSVNSDCCSESCKLDFGTGQRRCLPADKECIYCSSSDSCNYYDTGACTNADSDAAKEICEANGTWVDHCTSGAQDCDETGVDCGGADCSSCETSCHTTPLWSWDYCSTDCKCDIGEGDCDNDTHCNIGYCAKDVGAKYGQDSTMDVCEGGIYDMLIFVSPQYKDDLAIESAINNYITAVKSDINWDIKSIDIDSATNDFRKIDDIMEDYYTSSGGKLKACLMVGEDIHTALLADASWQEIPTVMPWETLGGESSYDIVEGTEQIVGASHQVDISVSLLYPTHSQSYQTRSSKIVSALNRFASNRKQTYPEDMRVLIDSSLAANPKVKYTYDSLKNYGNLLYKENPSQLEINESLKGSYLMYFVHGHSDPGLTIVNDVDKISFKFGNVDELDTPMFFAHGCYSGGWWTLSDRDNGVLDYSENNNWYGSRIFTNPNLRLMVLGFPAQSRDPVDNNFIMNTMPDLDQGKTLAEAMVGDVFNGSTFLVYGDPTFHYEVAVQKKSITVTSPNGGESWKTGETRSIKWISEGLASDNKISEISLKKGASTVKTIAMWTANDGEYQWLIPSDLNTGSDYKIYVEYASNGVLAQDESDNYFTITKSTTCTSDGATCSVNSDCCSESCKLDLGTEQRRCLPADKECIYCSSSDSCNYYDTGACTNVDSDSTNEVCKSNGTWVDHCSSGAQDCDEDGVDCGGADCSSCDTSCHTTPLWSWDYCSTDCKCDAGEGDCDNDTHCNTGYCAKDVGAKYGQVSTMDVCEEKEATSSITVISPNGGETLIHKGSSFKISWSSTNAPKGSHVELWRMKGDPGTGVRIANNLSNSGSFEWVPEIIVGVSEVQGVSATGDRTYSNYIEARLCKVDGSCSQFDGTLLAEDRSDKPFRVNTAGDNPLYVKVAYPNGGETLYEGNTYTIKWTSSEIGSDEEVQIGYRDKDRSSELGDTPIATVSNTGSYGWTVPSSLTSDQYLISMHYTPSSLFASYDYSDDYFSITGDTSCHTTPLWSWDYCSTDCKCDAGEGDCDNDTECNTGYCAKDVGTKYGQDSTMDVCEEQTTTCAATDWYGTGDVNLKKRLAEKGTCEDGTGIHTDVCTGDGKLRDYYCGPLQGDPKSCDYVDYSCTGYGFDGCKDGACFEEACASDSATCSVDSDCCSENCELDPGLGQKRCLPANKECLNCSGGIGGSGTYSQVKENNCSTLRCDNTVTFTCSGSECTPASDATLTISLKGDYDGMWEHALMYLDGDFIGFAGNYGVDGLCGKDRCRSYGTTNFTISKADLTNYLSDGSLVVRFKDHTYVGYCCNAQHMAKLEFNYEGDGSESSVTCNYYDAGACTNVSGDSTNEVCKADGTWVGHCSSGAMDCGEDGVDCGGADCASCSTCSSNNQTCSTGSDCCSERCELDPGTGQKRCLPANKRCIYCSSSDSCSYYDAGACTNVSGDSTNEVCKADGTWVGHCSSGAMDCGEDGVDCGGADCASCETTCTSNSATCSVNSDCCSENCELDPGTGQNRCVASGKECIYCSSSDSCSYYDAGACTNVSGDSTNEVCKADGTWVGHCSSGAMDCGEDGVDCGGADCASCSAGPSTYSQTKENTCPAIGGCDDTMSFTCSGSDCYPTGDGTLTLSLKGDYDGSAEDAFIYFDGNFIKLMGGVGRDGLCGYDHCNSYYSETFTISQADLTTYLSNGSFEVRFTDRPYVDNCCKASHKAKLEFSYGGGSPSLTEMEDQLASISKALIELMERIKQLQQ